MKTQTVAPAKKANSLKDLQAMQAARETAPLQQASPEKEVAVVAEPEVKEGEKAKTEEHDFTKDMFRRSPKKEEESEEKPAEERAEKEPVIDLKPKKAVKAKEEVKTEDKTDEVVDEKKDEKKTVLKSKPAKEPVDLEKLVSSAVKATAEALRPEKAETKTEVPKLDVPRRRTKDFDSIVRAEESGRAHKGSAAAAAETFRAEDEYIKKWENENGRKFNVKDSAHDDWYERNIPDWIEEAAEAGETISQQESLKKSLIEDFEKTHVSPLRKELEQLRMQEQQREVEARMPQSVNMAIGTVIHALNPELLKDGVKINEVDPLAHEILTTLAPKIAEETRAVHMQFATMGKALPAGDVLGDKIIATAYEIDAELQQRSEKELTAPDGKTYVPLDKFSTLTDAQKKSHWTVNADIVSMKMAAIAAEKAKSDYQSETEKLERLAASRGWVKRDVSQATESKSGDTEQEEASSNEKPRSPSTASTTVIKPGAKAEVKVALKPEDQLFNGMFRRLG